jgi:hypothetical protein
MYDVFDRLIRGLAAYLPRYQAGQVYPFPPEWRAAQDALALTLGAAYPHTLSGVIDLCSLPLHWWFPAPVPPGYERVMLVTSDNTLSAAARRYVAQEG